MRLRIGQILGVASLASAIIAASVWTSVLFIESDTTVKSFAARSIDISDPVTRLAFLDLIRGPRLWSNSLTESCGPGSHDVARMSYWPAFAKPSMIELNDFHGSGAVTRYELTNESIMVPDKARRLSSMRMESRALVFAALSELTAEIDKLLAGYEPIAVDDLVFDGTRMVLEICRQGHYFFFMRKSVGDDPSAKSQNLNGLVAKLLKFDPLRTETGSSR